MAKLLDLLNTVGVGDDGVTPVYPETFVSDLTSAYDEDMQIPTSKIEVLENELAEARAKIVELQAHNYELITQIPSDTPDDANDDTDNDDEEPQGVDSLFKEED